MICIVLIKAPPVVVLPGLWEPREDDLCCFDQGAPGRRFTWVLGAPTVVVSIGLREPREGDCLYSLNMLNDFFRRHPF